MPVYVKAGGTVSNFVTMSIAPTGGACSDPTGFKASELSTALTGANIADIVLTQLYANFTFGSTTMKGTLDLGEAHFRNYAGNNLLGATRGALAGYANNLPSVDCLVYNFVPTDASFFDNAFASTGEKGFNSQMDAGANLNFTTTGGQFSLARQGSTQNFFYGTGGPIAGSLPPAFPGGPEVIFPGNISVSNGSGGKDVGGFTSTINVPSTSINPTNAGALGTVTRSQGLTVTWSGASNYVLIQGTSANFATGAGATFTCTAPGAAGTFTVPAAILQALPASGTATDVNAPMGSLGIGTTLSAPVRFSAAGVATGYFNWVQLFARNANYQ